MVHKNLGTNQNCTSPSSRGSGAWLGQEGRSLGPAGTARPRQCCLQHREPEQQRHGTRLYRGRFQVLHIEWASRLWHRDPKYQRTDNGCSTELLGRQPAQGAATFGSVLSSRNHLLLHPTESLHVSDHNTGNLSIPTGTKKTKESTTVVLNFKKCNYIKGDSLLKALTDSYEK